jgi:hypothetical protein
MFISFFDIRGIIQFESVPEATTVNQTFCVEMLKRLIDAWGASEQSCGEIAGWLFITTPRRQILRLSVAVSSRRRHLCYGSYAILSWLSSSWLLAVRVCWKESVSLMLRILNHLRENLLQTSLSRILKTVSNNGRTAGNIVNNWRKIILKNSRLLISEALKIYV